MLGRTSGSICESDEDINVNEGSDDPGFDIPFVIPTDVKGCVFPMSDGVGFELLHESQQANLHVSSVQTSIELASLDERQTLISGIPHVEVLLIGEKSDKVCKGGNKLAV